MKEEDKNKWEIEKKKILFCDCGNMLKKKNQQGRDFGTSNLTADGAFKILLCSLG